MTALGHIAVLGLLFLFLPLLALDRQHVVADHDLDILLLQTRQFDRDLLGIVLHDDIDGRRGHPRYAAITATVSSAHGGNNPTAMHAFRIADAI